MSAIKFNTQEKFFRLALNLEPSIDLYEYNIPWQAINIPSNADCRELQRQRENKC